MTWIQMRSGRAVELMDPKAADIDRQELALLLTRLGRWGNHTLPVYTVAEHSVRVSLLVEDMARGSKVYGDSLTTIDLALAGLLHDCHEGPLGLDATRPLKDFIGEVLAPLADAWDYAIAEHFQIDPALMKHPLVKLADNMLLATEHRDVMAPCQRRWEWVPPAPLAEVIVPSEDPEGWFLSRLTYLEVQRRTYGIQGSDPEAGRPPA